MAISSNCRSGAKSRQTVRRKRMIGEEEGSRPEGSRPLASRGHIFISEKPSTILADSMPTRTNRHVGTSTSGVEANKYTRADAPDQAARLIFNKVQSSHIEEIKLDPIREAMEISDPPLQIELHAKNQKITELRSFTKAVWNRDNTTIGEAPNNELGTMSQSNKKGEVSLALEVENSPMVMLNTTVPRRVMGNGTC
ncbi:hypothetical protein HAX54_006913 [Datura stramonium]|uniref:Uncharacterized protein n=1 Tax=Datura stramonium TaxID=4076 RepID=A0ABS8TCC7_DATST|nr:hypothetical protein [Datura stramonium]